MTKYLIILACIVGVAGAANAGQAVANLEITADGHAYLVFADGGSGNLTGYDIESPGETPPFLRPNVLDTSTGELAIAWKSIDAQGQPAGELTPGAEWFFDGEPVPPSFIGEGNMYGHMARAPGTPIYLGKILASFDGTENIIFRSSDVVFPANHPIEPAIITLEIASVSLRTRDLLVQGTTDIANGVGTASSIWRETGDVGQTADVGLGIPATRLNVTHVENLGISGTDVVADLVVTGNAAGVTTLGGHVNVGGTEAVVQNADLVDVGATRLLRVQAGTAGALTAGASVTVAIDANLGNSIEDTGIGRSGTTLVSSMAISKMSGDFVTTSADVNPTPDGASNDQDIDAISAQIGAGGPAAGTRSLLFDVTRDGAVTSADRDLLISTLVETTGGNGTTFGDADLNGTTNLDDYILVWAPSFIAGGGTGAGGWADGDLDGNGIVNLDDYILSWAPAFIAESAAAPTPVATPEPATMTLLAMGALALVRRRRRA